MEAAPFESFPATTRAWIVSAKFFLEQLVAVHDTNSAFDFGLRREASSSLTHGPEKKNFLKFRRA
jgi:hypothetical protein